ncbi:MAG: 50S ribosome-binding GTPase, partial [Clostridia bacterium]|nr:50S ribosome-binding GTPase [Clostridia bacterium]
VVGIPNVGKSAFINKIAGKASTITGDRPGVTRTQQWVRINPEIQLLDTPGILWPKFEDVEIGLNLAATGAIKDEIMDTAELAGKLLEKLAVLYPQRIKERYKLADVEGKLGIKLLEEAGRKRGCLVSGGEVDLYRIATIVLDEFRGGKIGKITLELPPKADTEEAQAQPEDKADTESEKSLPIESDNTVQMGTEAGFTNTGSEDASEDDV